MARTISCKAWNSPAEYPSRECKHHIKESKGNMYNPIFKENVQGQKHPGSFTDDNYDIIWIILTQHMSESWKIYQYKYISLINTMSSMIINFNFVNCTQFIWQYRVPTLWSRWNSLPFPDHFLTSRPIFPTHMPYSSRKHWWLYATEYGILVDIYGHMNSGY